MASLRPPSAPSRVGGLPEMLWVFPVSAVGRGWDSRATPWAETWLLGPVAEPLRACFLTCGEGHTLVGCEHELTGKRGTDSG